VPGESKPSRWSRARSLAPRVLGAAALVVAVTSTWRADYAPLHLPLVPHGWVSELERSWTTVRDQMSWELDRLRGIPETPSCREWPWGIATRADLFEHAAPVIAGLLLVLTPRRRWPRVARVGALFGVGGEAAWIATNTIVHGLDQVIFPPYDKWRQLTYIFVGVLPIVVAAALTWGEVRRKRILPTIERAFAGLALVLGAVPCSRYESATGAAVGSGARGTLVLLCLALGLETLRSSGTVRAAGETDKLSHPPAPGPTTA